MRDFLEVSRAGSISAAARSLGLPRATLSRRISQLENELSIRLIHRRTTRLVLTAAGEELAQRAARIVADADEAWASVRRLDDVPRGLLRVSVTGSHFHNLFLEYARDFPDVRLEVFSTSRHVDLIGEGVDVAIRVGEIKDTDLIARQVHSDRSLLVASKAYAAQHGMPSSLEELKNHRCIVGFSGDWKPSLTWPLLDGGSFPVANGFAANAIGLIKTLILDNYGLGLMPSALVSDELDCGDVLPILADVVGTELPTSVVYADRDFIEPKVRQFVDRAVLAIRDEMPKPYSF